MTDELKIAGISVGILLEQMERLAERCRGSTRAFQYAGALDNAAAVINELLKEREAGNASTDAMGTKAQSAEVNQKDSQ